MGAIFDEIRAHRVVGALTFGSHRQTTESGSPNDHTRGLPLAVPKAEVTHKAPQPLGTVHLASYPWKELRAHNSNYFVPWAPLREAKALLSGLNNLKYEDYPPRF